jgi:two-component system LytT family sensor kinase
MKSEKKKRGVLRIIVDELIMLIICGFIGIAASTFFSRGFHRAYIDMEFYYGMLIGYPLFKVNRFSGYFIERNYPWKEGPFRTLILSFTSGIFLSIITIVIVNILSFVYIYKQPFTWTGFIAGTFYAMVSELFITIIIILSYYVADFFREWKILLLREEQFKREALSLQFDALKNQVNPHFLFNSLNVLTSLVETDPPQAVKFIKQLSDVYRYVLEHKDKELIDLNTELQFVNAFVYLQKIRFDSSLVVNISLEGTTGRIIPLSLQMLVENAIKHNIISVDKPLVISITSAGDYIVVKNNLQKKMVIQETGSIGLNNIRDRYAYFSKLPVVIEDTGAMFTVKLPLIEQ